MAVCALLAGAPAAVLVWAGPGAAGGVGPADVAGAGAALDPAELLDAVVASTQRPKIAGAGGAERPGQVVVEVAAGGDGAGRAAAAAGPFAAGRAGTQQAPLARAGLVRTGVGEMGSGQDGRSPSRTACRWRIGVVGWWLGVG